MTESLDAWIHRQYRIAAVAMLRSVSPVKTVKTRPGFGQSIRASKGSIVASPILGAYDPDPDYFFHWFRDSAIVIDALRLLFEDGTLGGAALAHFADFVRFSLSLRDLDGRVLAASPSWRTEIGADVTHFIRTDEDLATAHGEAVAAETRVNPDGSLDISIWPRPQNDGAALRALALLRWARSGAPFDAELGDAVSTLLRADIAFTLRRWREPCFDLREEEKGLHYYTLRVQAAALEECAGWLDKLDDRIDAEVCRREAATILRRLDEYWHADEGFYRSRILDSGVRSGKERDMAVILATVHAAGRGETHSVRDERMHVTLARLEALFDAEYAINLGRSVTTGPAMGRYPGDVYYSGGAWYLSTLGAAEFCFRAAVVEGSEDRALALLRRGEGFLETVRAFTPPSGHMSEQFDQKTGAQTSAKHLAWSYAAFISCVAARQSAMVRP